MLKSKQKFQPNIYKYKLYKIIFYNDTFNAYVYMWINN